ncbi:hypothetical protein Csa_018235 [Cucumis sativus]|nr:hypothetical protein Csa_018235 [Cucumis sativus]
MLEMFHDLERPIFEENRRESNVGDGTSGMFCEVEEELYPECRKFTLFNSLVKLMHIEVLICWSYKSYDILLELLNEAFLDGVNLPTSYYEAKKMLHDLGYDDLSGWSTKCYKTCRVCNVDTSSIRL